MQALKGEIMEKEYKKPLIEKVTYDYKIQTTASTCFGSIINVATSVSECGEGTPSYIGWNKEHPGP